MIQKKDNMKINGNFVASNWRGKHTDLRVINNVTKKAYQTKNGKWNPPKAHLGTFTNEQDAHSEWLRGVEAREEVCMHLGFKIVKCRYNRGVTLPGTTKSKCGRKWRSQIHLGTYQYQQDALNIWEGFQKCMNG